MRELFDSVIVNVLW